MSAASDPDDREKPDRSSARAADNGPPSHPFGDGQPPDYQDPRRHQGDTEQRKGCGEGNGDTQERHCAGSTHQFIRGGHYAIDEVTGDESQADGDGLCH